MTALPAAPIVLCLGTRPEIIKMAPVHHALRAAGERPVVLHTGQHDEMAWPLYDFFGIRPDEVIGLQRRKPGLAHLSAELIGSISERLEALRPRAVLVHGDTTTALMAAMAAFYLKIPIGHVEAGLRTHERYDPFPEETNRTLIARIADWHFAPTPTARHNLACEGVTRNVVVTGNTAVDAARWGSRQMSLTALIGIQGAPSCLGRIAKLPSWMRLLLVTAHRRENWDGGIAQIALAVRTWLEQRPDYAAVWPVHGNPQVADAVHAAFADADAGLSERLFLSPPVDYSVLLALLSRCWLVLTDSGGIQEEAAAVDRPVLVLRDTTERPELLETGRGVLVGARAASIGAQLDLLDRSPEAYAAMCSAPNPFGDGRASERIAAALQHDTGSIGTEDDEVVLAPPATGPGLGFPVGAVAAGPDA